MDKNNSKPADQSVNELMPIYDKAALESQLRRHQNINNLFEKAVMVIDGYLDDTNIESVSKMLPAKMALDLYTTQEKFKREDARIEIEKRKLAIEEKKANIPPLSGATINQNNINISTSPEEMAKLKKKQDELLASFRSKTQPTSD